MSLMDLSHPTMGAWIEIAITLTLLLNTGSHPTMGAWIEIFIPHKLQRYLHCRTPRWVRGLKFGIKLHAHMMRKVAPHDGCVD